MIFSKENNPKGFYVYAYLREDDSPYYVGKGKGNRAWKKGLREVKPPNNDSHIQIKSHNLTEDAAFELEKKLISQYGRKDIGTGILRNKSDGGDGNSGYKWTEQQKDKRRGENNPMYGRVGSLAPNYKRIPKQESIEKWKETRKGYTTSDNTKQKLRESCKGINLGENNPMANPKWKLTCPYCNKTMDKGNYTRYHGDKCKLK